MIKSSDQTDLKGTSDLELGRTQRKSCSPRPVAAPVKRKLDVSANTRISEELVEADNAPMHMILGPAHRSHNPNRLVLFYLLNLSSFFHILCDNLYHLTPSGLFKLA
jgi:hypothetical protein